MAINCGLRREADGGRRTSRGIQPGKRTMDRAAGPGSTPTIRGQLLDRLPLSAGEDTVDKEHNDGANHRTDQACAFSGPVPSERLAEITRHEGADDAQYGGENEARGLVISRHNEFSDHAGNETNDDRPKYTHLDAPFLIASTLRPSLH